MFMSSHFEHESMRVITYYQLVPAMTVHMHILKRHGHHDHDHDHFQSVRLAQGLVEKFLLFLSIEMSVNNTITFSSL